MVELATAEELLELRTAPFNAAATWADIATVHDRAFVEAVRAGHPLGLAQSQGFRWSPTFADAVARIWSGHIAACRLALVWGQVLHPVSGAHHAGFARGSGFCTFNYLAGAASALLADGLARLAIVDLDAHQGNGTLELVGQNPSVGLFDIAGGRWCQAPENGRVEYRLAYNAGEYRAALERLPDFLDKVHPLLVQYQAGMDPFEGDGVGGIDGVDEAFLASRDRFVIEQVRSRGIPLVVNLAGGYAEGVSERLHVNTVRIMASTA